MMVSRHLSIPSVELQTIEFVYDARRTGGTHEACLSFNGFHVCLEYNAELTVPRVGVLKATLSVQSVYVPPRYRRRGWLSTYLSLCHLLAEDALFVAGTYGGVRQSLIRDGFEEVAPGILMCRS
ncbi:hypothetical protein [Denitromonas sp.]|uniref:hypothetical protein n=1 Tax=Denitromonas sp. TaxID=2734609 RepID=UPI002AFE7718|nr:hypothetical protein [Denitromonas sp.]